MAKGVAAALNGGKLNAVLCVAGGWAGGNAADASASTARAPSPSTRPRPPRALTHPPTHPYRVYPPLPASCRPCPHGTGFVANTELMVKQSIHSSVIAAHVAAHHLAEYGAS